VKNLNLKIWKRIISKTINLFYLYDYIIGINQEYNFTVVYAVYMHYNLNYQQDLFNVGRQIYDFKSTNYKYNN